MAYKAYVTVKAAAEGSRFSADTLILENLGGQMPTWKKDDGSASSVFPINKAIKPANMNVGDSGLATFDLRWNKGMEQFEYQVISFSHPKSLLDEMETVDYLVTKFGTQNIAFTPTKEKKAESGEPVKTAETPMP